MAAAKEAVARSAKSLTTDLPTKVWLEDLKRWTGRLKADDESFRARSGARHDDEPPAAND